MAKKGGWAPQKPAVTQQHIPRRDTPNKKTSWKTSFLNPDPLTHWSGPENTVHFRINSDNSCVLLDNVSTINAVTPDFIKTWSLDVSLLSDLVDHTIGINGFGGLFSQPLSYIIIRVQLEGVRRYNEDQVALVIPDSTAFGSWVPATLGTPTINWIINEIKESEKDKLLASLNGSIVSHLLACHWAELLIRSGIAANQTMGPTDLNEAVKMIKIEEIEAFSSKIIHTQTKTIFLGSNMHVMMQALGGGDGPCLPHSLSVMNTYTKMTTGNKRVAVVLKNLTATLITIA